MLIRRMNEREVRLSGFTAGRGGPALLDLFQKAVPVRLQRPDKRLVAGFFVPRGPQHHLGQYRSQIDALRRKRINELAPVGWIGLRGNDSMTFQSAQTVGQHVGGYTFVRSQKFLECSGPAHHHVANNQQRPPIAQHLDGRIQGTPRAALGMWLGFWHGLTVTFSLAFRKLNNP